MNLLTRLTWSQTALLRVTEAGGSTRRDSLPLNSLRIKGSHQYTMLAGGGADAIAAPECSAPRR
jgi:hypothetical protein